MPCITGGPAARVALSVTDVGKPACAHGRTKLIPQFINGFGNSRPFVLPHVICKAKILMHLTIIRISDISVISAAGTSVSALVVRGGGGYLLSWHQCFARRLRSGPEAAWTA